MAIKYTTKEFFTLGIDREIFQGGRRGGKQMQLEAEEYVHALLDEIKRDEDTIMHEPTVHPDVEFYLERIEANKAEIRRVRGLDN